MKPIQSRECNMKKNYWFWGLMLFSILICFFVVTAYAVDAPTGSIGSAAKSITTSMGDLARLITAGSYVAGFGFAVGAILKFKAHKDNPTQIPVGTPVALIFIAAALIFLPSIFGMVGKTTGVSTVGGVSGTVTVPGVK